MVQQFITYLVYTGQSFYPDRKNISNSKFLSIDPLFQNVLFNQLTNNPMETLFEASFEKDLNQYDPSIIFLIDVIKEFIHLVTDTPDVQLNKKAPVVNDSFLFDLSKKVPFTYGCEFINIIWLKNFWKSLSLYFEKSIEKYNGTIAEFIHSKNPKIQLSSRVYFHLVENKDDYEYPFAFLATYATVVGKQKIYHVPIRQAMKEFTNQEDLVKLLSSIIDASDKSDFIKTLMDSGELFTSLKMSKEEALTFLKEVEIYESCGIVCRIPNFWKKKQNFQVKVVIADKEPSKVGLDSLVDFTPFIYFDNEQLTKDDIDKLLIQQEGLTLIKGKWVEVNHNKLNELIKRLEEVKKDSLTLLDTIKLKTNLLGRDDGIDSIEIDNGTWLSDLTSKMSNPVKITDIKLNDSFNGKLRPYQQIGLNWLNFMVQNKLGCILADDMGLGKTIQILALLSVLLPKRIKTLLIVPASLLVNWEKEICKFSQNISFKILHGSDKNFDVNVHDLFITTYATSSKISGLSEHCFDLVILDEAQNIKNILTKNTKFIKQLRGKCRIALTGTPIENDLTELWSIFDFINPGLLGTITEFSNFVKSLKNSSDGFERLRKIIAPFILRRLKTDKHIISDLPKKNEIKQYVGLTKKQIVLYQQIVNDLSESIEHADKFKKRLLVLTSIMKLKQICNHPDQYLGNHQYINLDSEKFISLIELCKMIKERHERVLIFTQFKEITQPIANLLEDVFSQPGLILHGSIPVNQRGKLIAQFNNDAHYVPFMVLSLKAGGIGLNLTAANNVIHFDRWWNPAVENQATDRAYRIGQRKDVMIYKLITTGTIEEKIDNIIMQKQKLANDIISQSNETSWISELDNNQIMSLFKLEV